MSFFGFDTSHDALEKEKEKFREGGLGTQEDVAVYTWGESDYDGLGDALQEGGDELNDETFGGSGPVGANMINLHSLVTHQYIQARTLISRAKIFPKPKKVLCNQSLITDTKTRCCMGGLSNPVRRITSFVCVLLAYLHYQRDRLTNLWSLYGMTSHLSQFFLECEAQAALQAQIGRHPRLPPQTLKDPRRHRSLFHVPVMHLVTLSRVSVRSKRSKQKCVPNKASRTMYPSRLPRPKTIFP
jgi:hypothetical protein